VPTTTGRLARRSGARDSAVAHVRRRRDGALAGEAAQHRPLVAQRDVEGVGEGDRRLPPRVVGAADDAVAEQCAGRDAQPAEDGGADLSLLVVEGELQLGDAEHGRRMVEAVAVRRWGGRAGRSIQRVPAAVEHLRAAAARAVSPC
jgi:hypothetical protein